MSHALVCALTAAKIALFRVSYEASLRALFSWSTPTASSKSRLLFAQKNEAVPPQHYLSPNQIKPNYSLCLLDRLECCKDKVALCKLYKNKRSFFSSFRRTHGFRFRLRIISVFGEKQKINFRKFVEK
jgi:hypothetical protein